MATVFTVLHIFAGKSCRYRYVIRDRAARNANILTWVCPIAVGRAKILSEMPHSSSEKYTT